MNNTTAPQILIDSPFNEISYTASYYTGIITYSNKQRETAGRADAQFFETFEEHNARTGNNMTAWDWDTVQADHVAKRDEEREAWANRKIEWEAVPENERAPFQEPEPEVLTAKAMPAWLSDQLAGKDAFLATRWQIKNTPPPPPPPPPNYKIWGNAQAFMAELTMPEKVEIALSTDATIAALRLELSTWFSEVHSNDPRVIAGLDKLVELSILTETRKDEITTI